MARKNFLIALLEDFNPENKDIILDDNKLMEGIKPAFGSPGGKFFVAGKLIALFPEQIGRYVEPFIGGGSILFRKNKTEGEFINDKDEEIFFLFKFMQNLTDQQLEALNKKDWTTKKEIFDSMLQSYRESPAKDPIERFYQVTYLKAASDAGEMRSYDDRAEGEIMKLTTRLAKIKERLAGVTIENMDYKDFVKKYSTAESFTFLDPPYPSAKMSWKWCPTQEEFESFTKTVPGKWMITYEVCDGWKESKYYRKILSQYNLAAPSAGHMTRKSELVVTNYPMKQNASFLSEEVDLDIKDDVVDFVSNIRLPEENKKDISKESEKNIGNFVLYHQWWKVKHLEGKNLDSFIIATDLKTDLFLDNNPLNEGFKESIFYLKPATYGIAEMNESVSFLAPGNSMNRTERPSWIKILDSGKISVLESSKLEKTIEFSGEKLKGIYTAKRESENSDFWVLKK